MRTPTTRDVMRELEAASKRLGIPLSGAKPRACGTCPFRTKNHGVETELTPADGADRMWQGARDAGGCRDGQPMLCHCGQNTKTFMATWVSDIPEWRQCTGAIVVQQRE